MAVVGCVIWTQFADDAAIISDNFKETQLLLNLFQRWTAWAYLIIRPDKCCAYAAAQRNGRYQQIKLFFSVDGVKIPSIEIGASMTYLGHQFSFASDAEIGKSLLSTLTKEAIDLSHLLPINPILKCHALNLLLRSKLSFLLTHYTIGLTWLKTNLDNLVTERVRRWLSLPPCSTCL